MTNTGTVISIADRQLADHVHEIRRLGKQTVENVIEIGRRLVECKALVGHGNFGSWLKTEFGWTDRHARNFIHVYECFGKTENFSDLSIQLSALYLLAAPSTPVTVRKDTIERASKGEKVSHKDVADRVKESNVGMIEVNAIVLAIEAIDEAWQNPVDVANAFFAEVSELTGDNRPQADWFIWRLISQLNYRKGAIKLNRERRFVLIKFRQGSNVAEFIIAAERTIWPTKSSPTSCASARCRLPSAKKSANFESPSTTIIAATKPRGPRREHTKKSASA